MDRVSKSVSRLTIILIIVFAVGVRSQDKPKIVGCFSNSSSVNSTGCQNEFSNSEFLFEGRSENFTAGTVILTNHNELYLHLRCNATVPIRWLSHKPVGDITYQGGTYFTVSASETNPNETVFSEYTQKIRVSIQSDFSRILRCENFNDSTLAAEVFLNMPEPGAKADKLVPFEKRGLNFFITDTVNIAREYTVPCVAKSFGILPNVTLTRRNSKAPIFSEKCAVCTCFGSSECPNSTFPCFSSNICGSLSMSIWDNNTNPIDEYLDCIRNFGCSICTVQSHMSKFPSTGKDCNGDNVLTCEDYARQFLFGEDSCTGDLQPQQKEIFERFEVCYEQADENHTRITDKNIYDPRIGFRLKLHQREGEKPDLENMYECSSTLHSVFYMNPVTEDNRIRAKLVSPNNADITSITCTPDDAVHNLNIQIGSCNSITECDFKYKAMKPFISFIEEEPRNSDVQKFFSINSTTVIQPNFLHGFVQCAAIFHPAEFPKTLGYTNESMYMFQGVDGKRHYFQSRFDANESIIAIGIDSPGYQIVNRFYVIECTISTFILLPTVRFYVQYKGDDPYSELTSDKAMNYTEFPEDKAKATRKFTVRVNVTKDMDIIYCQAPAIDTGNPATATLDLDVQDEPPSVLFYIAIIGAVILFLVMAASVLVLWRKWVTSKSIIRNLTKNEVYEFFHGDKSQREGGDEAFIIEALGFSKDKAIATDRLVVNSEDVLGSGQFGVVCRGSLDDHCVAVKTTKPNADVDYFKAFLTEIKVINFIGEHANIIYFHGAVVDKIQQCVCYAAFEFSPFGNLNKYLKDYAANYVGSVPGEPQKKTPTPLPGSESQVVLNQSILTSFCQQIATGMAFLAEKKVIHGDLAARNVLVFHNNVVKITDFGLSRKLYECGNYVKKKQAPLPWRWMALESLRYMEFSSQSDVWSLGVTVWEIFSFAQVPFAGLTWSPDFVEDIEGGLRLAKPQHVLPEVFEWMMTCWENDPVQRPTLSDCQGFFINYQSKVHQVDKIYGSLNAAC